MVKYMAVGQNLVPLVNIKIAGNTHKWLLIGIDPYPYVNTSNVAVACFDRF
jgi:hypothetical protein